MSYNRTGVIFGNSFDKGGDLVMHERQRRILRCIRWLKAEQDRVPTVREIGNHTGIPAPGMVSYHLGILQEEGFIDKEPHRARTLRITQRGLEYLRKEAAT
jgi:SOS-response transcriptional repressor LexA